MRLGLALLVAGCMQGPLDIGFRRVDLGHQSGPAQPCESDDDCGAGNSCESPAPGVRFCTQACSYDPCTQPTFPGGIAPVCSAGFCTLSCNPVGATDGTQGCPGGSSCLYDLVPVDDTTVETSDCWKPGTAGEGADCANPYDCVAGLFCDGVCRRVCRLGSSSLCRAGQSCQAPFSGVASSFGVCS